jgi:hypothetical protein
LDGQRSTAAPARRLTAAQGLGPGHPPLLRPGQDAAANQGIPKAADAGIAPNPPTSDLARVVSAWPDLPEAIRRAVLALVGSANG